MPGYGTERFVDLSQNDKAELTCSICQDILCNPLVAQCCQQSFCGDCINDWLINNNTCPYDRETLNSSGLTRPSRIMLNMLGKLKINCDYKENGCKEVLLLENLSQHLIKCRYNVGKCKKCFCETQDKSSHDCIETLLELNRKANEKIETFERNLYAKLVSPHPTTGQSAQYNKREESLLSENQELRAEKENLLQTIEEMSNNIELQNTQNNISFTEILNQARKSLWKHDVINTNMNQDIRNKLLSIVRNELVKEYSIDSDLSKNIVDKLNAEFGSRWYCMVSHNNQIKSVVDCEPGYFISLRFSVLYLKIYKTEYIVVKEFAELLRNGKIRREIKIFDTDMNENMISDVKNITFEAIDKSNTFKDISFELETQMERRYSGIWQCFLYSHFGGYTIINKPGTYISFDVDRLRIILFQTSSNIQSMFRAFLNKL